MFRDVHTAIVGLIAFMAIGYTIAENFYRLNDGVIIGLAGISTIIVLIARRAIFNAVGAKVKDVIKNALKGALEDL